MQDNKETKRLFHQAMAQLFWSDKIKNTAYLEAFIDTLYRASVSVFKEADMKSLYKEITPLQEADMQSFKVSYNEMVRTRYFSILERLARDEEKHVLDWVSPKMVQPSNGYRRTSSVKQSEIMNGEISFEISEDELQKVNSAKPDVSMHYELPVGMVSHRIPDAPSEFEMEGVQFDTSGDDMALNFLKNRNAVDESDDDIGEVSFGDDLPEMSFTSLDY